MPARDLAPARLEELLRGAPPESEHEAHAEGVIRALRALDGGASPELRERVRASARRPVQLRWRPPVRVAAVVAAAALGVSPGGYALTLPTGGDDAGSEPSRGAGAQVEADAGGEEAAVVPSSGGIARVEKQRRSAAPGAAGFIETVPTASQVPPSAGRVRDVDMSLELRVRDADAVAAAAADAMRAADALGGHVAASAVDARGSEGRARLMLLVPVVRLQDAVVRLSALGTITAQNVQVEDLQGRIDGRENRIQALGRALRRVGLRLRSGTLDAQERLELELRKESLEAQLRTVRRARVELLRRGAMVEIQLALHTREAATAARDADDGLAGAARSGWHVLSTLGGGAVFLLIVGSPLLLLGALAWALRRARDRRVERRLLDEPPPVAARPPA